MNTIYLPNTQNIWDLLESIEQTHPNGQVITRECIEIKTASTPIANFLKAITAAPKTANGNGIPHIEPLDEERTCTKCGKQFNPITKGQKVCKPCRSEMGRIQIANRQRQTGHTPPAADQA